MELNSLEELLNDNLKDIYNAENQLLKALPKMSKNACSDSLREALDSHLHETETQVKRLEHIGEILGIKLGGKKCAAMQGLIEEGSEVLKSKGEEAVLDLGIIGAAQRVEHYEISAYGTARTFAERLGMSEVAELLQESLDEEAAADKKLTRISEEELLSESPRGNGRGGTASGTKTRHVSGNGKKSSGRSSERPAKKTGKRTTSRSRTAKPAATGSGSGGSRSRAATGRRAGAAKRAASRKKK